MSMYNSVLVPRIESSIQVTHGLRVMIDVDLAALYGVQTKRLNEQVERDWGHLRSDFLFQLTPDEKAEVVANFDHLQNLKFSKALPFAFTEHVAIQAAYVLDAVRQLTTPPEPIKKPIGFLTHGDKVGHKSGKAIKEKKTPCAPHQNFITAAGHDCSNKHERQAGEKAPIDVILCAESSREQVEPLQMHKDDITVAEYWTELPPKAEFEQHLHKALIKAREQLARGGAYACSGRG